MATQIYPSGLGTLTSYDEQTTYALGTAFKVAAAQTITGVYYQATADAAGLTVALGHGDNGEPSNPYLNDLTMTNITVVAGMNYIPFSEPFSLLADTWYVATVSTTGAYGALAQPSDVNQGNFSSFDTTAFGGFMGIGFFVAGALVPPNATPLDTNVHQTWYGIGVYWDETTTLSVSASANPAVVTSDQQVTLTATPTNQSGSVSYSWAQTAGSTVSLSSATTQTPTFTPTDSGTYSFTVTVTDSLTTAQATVSVAVTATPAAAGARDLWFKAGSDWVSVLSVANGPGIFLPEDFGAKGDGVTDDTQAIRDCVNAAIIAAPAYNYAVTVKFGPKTYLLASPVIQGGSTYYGNAQIPLQPVRSGNQKISLTFQGVGNGAPYSHWNQTVPMLTGTVLLSTLTGQTFSATYDAPAIIGGPSKTWIDPDADLGGIGNAFSNMLVRVDGITFSAPFNPSLACLNFRYIAAVDIGTISCIANVAKVNPSGNQLSTTPTDSGGAAVIMPVAGNNARTQFDTIIVEGFYYALIASEHVTGNELGAVYCNTALEIATYGGTARTHGITISHMTVEATTTMIDIPSGNSGIPLFVQLIDGESATTHVNDPGNALYGATNIYDIFNPTLTVNGAGNFTVNNLYH